MKKVFVHAYLAGNLGDDLMVSILCRRYPDVLFRIYASEEYKEVFKDIKNIKVYSPEDKEAVRWNWFWKKIKGADNGFWKTLVKFSYATVHIGGSSFVQHFDDYSAFYNTDATLRRLSKRMFVVGVNFGPYTDENYYKQYYQLFGEYDGVTFRDQYSYELFRQLPNVKCAADVVLNYEPVREHVQVKEKKQVLFSVIRLEDRNGKFAISQYTDAYKAFIVRLAEEFLDRGYRIKFVAFCEMQGDMTAIQEMISALDSEKREWIDSYCYRGNIEECIRLFEESEVIVGTRFHSIILGWLKKKKVLPIVYDNKTRNVLKDNACKVYVELDKLKETDAADLIQRIECLPEEQRTELVKNAEGQFWAVDRALGR